jgi:hypothetical protein
VFAANPIKVGMYWPDGWADRKDFGSPTLIEALQDYATRPNAWRGHIEFLDAVRAGNGRGYIEERRNSGIRPLAERILDPDESALDEARRAAVAI